MRQSNPCTQGVDPNCGALEERHYAPYHLREDSQKAMQARCDAKFEAAQARLRKQRAERAKAHGESLARAEVWKRTEAECKVLVVLFL